MNGTLFYFLLKNIKNASGKIYITFDEYIKYYDLDFDNENEAYNHISGVFSKFCKSTITIISRKTFDTRDVLVAEIISDISIEQEEKRITVTLSLDNLVNRLGGPLETVPLYLFFKSRLNSGSSKICIDELGIPGYEENTNFTANMHEAIALINDISDIEVVLTKINNGKYWFNVAESEGPLNEIFN